MTILQKIQALVRAKRVKYTYHAIEEKLNEINLRYNLYLDRSDIDSVILTGEIISIFDNDARGRRYAIVGVTRDMVTELEIVCRIEDNVVIITVYEQFI